MLGRAALVAAALISLSAEIFANETEVTLEVAGPPILAKDTGQPFIYRDPRQLGTQGGSKSQAWSMLGREDLAAKTSKEYASSVCDIVDASVLGEEAVLERIVAEAKATRVVIINESHTVKRHRDFSRKFLAALRPLGYKWLAAETFANAAGEDDDPVNQHAELPYPHQSLGYYSREPVFGAMLREAKALGYRFAAYEQVFDPEAEQPEDMDLVSAKREQEQADNLAKLLERLEEDEKLIIHVGYWHASELVTQRQTDGLDTSMMAARLARMTGVDPITIAQTECRGSGTRTQLSRAPQRIEGRFDLIVDHPAHDVRFGRPSWRFADGVSPVAIPEPYASAEEPLIIEAFAEGEPFDAVPIDRVWVEPGEDVRLALAPARYTVRAIIPGPASDQPPTTP